MKKHIASSLEIANGMLVGVFLLSSLTTAVIINDDFGMLINSSQVTYIEDIPPEVRGTLPEEVLRQIPSRYGNQDQNNIRY